MTESADAEFQGKKTSVSEQLIRVCSAPVPTSTRHKAAVHLLDWLGCIFAGAKTAPGESMVSLSQLGHFAPGQCFVCAETSLDATAAAFINGSLGNILEMDDVHRASILHAGDIILPAVLATSQQQGVGVVHMLDSIVRGYEVALRIGSLAASSGYSNWYNSGTCGVFGAATGCGFVLGLEQRQLVDCLGQAGMLGSGIWQCRFEPTWSKQLASANASRNGVMAAYLGQQKFPGARFIFEGQAGFFPTYYPQAEVSELNLQPVYSWLLHEVSFKPWSACRHNHPAIEAALKLRAKQSLDSIAELELETYSAAIDFCDNPAPANDHEARFSLQHCMAVALLRGEPAIADFQADARADKAVSDLCGKIVLKVSEKHDSRFPMHMGSSLVATLKSGEQVRIDIDNALGDPENPMSAAMIKKKFLKVAEFAGVKESNANALAELLLGDGFFEPTDRECMKSMQALNALLSGIVEDMRQPSR